MLVEDNRSLLNYRALRGVDTNGEHHLLIVLAGVKLKLCRIKRVRRGVRILYDKAKFRDQQIKKQFCIEIQTRFKTPTKNGDENIEKDWLQLKKVRVHRLL